MSWLGSVWTFRWLAGNALLCSLSYLTFQVFTLFFFLHPPSSSMLLCSFALFLLCFCFYFSVFLLGFFSCYNLAPLLSFAPLHFATLFHFSLFLCSFAPLPFAPVLLCSFSPFHFCSIVPCSFAPLFLCSCAFLFAPLLLCTFAPLLPLNFCSFASLIPWLLGF
jgi:hypothetical protein